MSALFSFPTIILIIIIIGRKHIAEIWTLLKSSIEKGWVRSVKIGKFFQIEWSNLENYQLTEIKSPNLENLDTFSKSTYHELPMIIEKAFTEKKYSKILSVNLRERIGSAPLYLYVRRLNNYFDLKVIVFMENKKLVGLIGVKELIYYLEKKFPAYNKAYKYAINISDELNLNELIELEKGIIDKFRSYRGESVILDISYIKDLFGSTLFMESFKMKQKMSKTDLTLLARFNYDFIPIIINNKYMGVLEKQRLIQEILINFVNELLRD
jgi:hypothetical protein